MKSDTEYNGLEIAIVGIGCRVRGSKNSREFWNNLKDGYESAAFYSDNDLLALGMTEEKFRDKNFIRLKNSLENKDKFDSTFFGYLKGDMAFLNPEHRIFHECVWEALEDSGYNSANVNGSIGLFYGGSDDLNWKLYANLTNANGSVDELTVNSLAGKDFLPTLISYKLGLNGTSISLNTACSTSLVAINLACKSLLLGENKIVVAGGIGVSTSDQIGYYYTEGMIYSVDGHCRAFDKDATGTIPGEGVGVVVLKRLSEAIKDKDHIYSIIKGGAVNNDGNRKVGYTAPSVEGQLECIKAAQKFAKVKPETISYIETHGTGTILGDPIEIEALNYAFNNDKEKYCAVGSVKTNIGHLDTAAGVIGLIKVALSLKHKYIPPSINYNEPNPKINFDEGPFYVNTKLTKWERKNNLPLRAAVSSFGIGGTNAHIILEEAPEIVIEASKRKCKLLSISAKTEDSLKRYVKDLGNYISVSENVNLEDMCYTFHNGRRAFEYRRSFAFKDREELLLNLNTNIEELKISKSKSVNSPIVFMFPGQGSQYLGMGYELYLSEELFKSEMDRGFSLLNEITGEDFKSIMFGELEDLGKINETCFAQPAIFVLEYALAKLLMSYGLHPDYMIGHSLGEYVAACISGVFDYSDVLKLLVKRGSLMNSLPGGIMVSASINEKEANKFVNENVSIAAINGTDQIVFSGNNEAMTSLMKEFDILALPYVKLQTSHAFHSAMLDSILEKFAIELRKIAFNKKNIKFISNSTGRLISDAEASSVDYWVNHMRSTVKFSEGIETLISINKEPTFLEVGVGNALCNLLKQKTKENGILSSNFLPNYKEKTKAPNYFTSKLGYLWDNGITINWTDYYKNENRRRVSLPTYSFEAMQYVAEVNPLNLVSKNIKDEFQEQKNNPDDWFYRIQWKQSVWLDYKQKINSSSRYLILSSSSSLDNSIIEYYSKLNIECFIVIAGTKYEKVSETIFCLDPLNEEHYEYLFKEFLDKDIIISNIIHLWNYNSKTEVHHTTGYESILTVVKSYLGKFSESHLHIDIIADGLYNVLGDETVHPFKSTMLGALKVIKLEYTNISCRAIDVPQNVDNSLSFLLQELLHIPDEVELAIRGNKRYIKFFDKIKFDMPKNISVFRQKGTYLITGATGGMAGLISNYLSEKFQANLILISRNPVSDVFIKNIEIKGGKVFNIQADISDFELIREGINSAESVFGNINGVLHTAGIADQYGIILNRKKEDDEKIFAAKVLGTNVLNRLFDKRLDFFVNFSALSASLSAFGQVGYVSANIFQDSIAEKGNSNYPLISIEWTLLSDYGMFFNSSNSLSENERVEHLKYSINKEEMIQVLERAIYLKVPTQLISKTDLSVLYRTTFLEFHNDTEHKKLNKTIDRTNISSTYIPPETETEMKVIAIFENFFGVYMVGIQDDFFELGGDSLKAMTFLKKINKEFCVNISIRDFMEGSTVKALCSEIDVIINLSGGNRLNSKTLI